MHYKTIRVEGFDLQKLLSQCLSAGISVWNIQIRGDLDMVLRLDDADWHRFLKLTKNRYRVTVITEKGIKPFIKKAFRKKSSIAGLILFVLLLYYQSTFVSEIRVYGYERLTEREILENLEQAGLYTGCSKSVDLDRIEIEMFKKIPDLRWIGIRFRGNLAEVTIVEGTEIIPEVNKDQPCHIVAAKEGYIEKSVARQGKEAVSKGDFVHVGDLLISGILPIEDKTYSRGTDVALERYVHAEGEVFARTVYRFIRYQEKDKLIKSETGRKVPGFVLSIGNLHINTTDLLWPYDSSIYEVKEVLDILWPVPVRFAIHSQKEVELKYEKKDEESIEKQAKLHMREAIKDNIPDSAQILNNSLKFSQEENIIKVTIMIEALEDIGTEKAFVPAATNQIKEITGGGTVSIGESAN